MGENVFSKEDLKDIAEGEVAYQKEIEEQYKKDDEVMKSVKKMLSPEIFKYLEEELEETEGGSHFKIVNEPHGENQDYDKYELWVDQTTNGGYSGDTFEGCCYFKIGEIKYLEWEYSM